MIPNGKCHIFPSTYTHCWCFHLCINDSSHRQTATNHNIHNSFVYHKSPSSMLFICGSNKCFDIEFVTSLRLLCSSEEESPLIPRSRAANQNYRDSSSDSLSVLGFKSSSSSPSPWDRSNTSPLMTRSFSCCRLYSRSLGRLAL